MHAIALGLSRAGCRTSASGGGQAASWVADKRGNSARRGDTHAVGLSRGPQGDLCDVLFTPMSRRGLQCSAGVCNRKPGGGTGQTGR